MTALERNSLISHSILRKISEVVSNATVKTNTGLKNGCGLIQRNFALLRNRQSSRKNKFWNFVFIFSNILKTEHSTTR